jgi:uncharacterized surface protein with fasciclin (FAS1) repeats
VLGFVVDLYSLNESRVIMKSLKDTLGRVAVLLIAVFAGIGTVQAQETVFDIVKESEDHAIFTQLLEKTKMKSLLEQEGPFTVLAPTDDAFEKLGKDFEELKNDNKQLQDLVIGHLFNGQINATDMEEAKSIEILTGDIEAKNGTVHIIENVLIE